MKKNSILKTLLIAGCLFFQTKVFADVEGAINRLRIDMLAALKGSADTSMVNQIEGLKGQLMTLFDDTFKGGFNPITERMDRLSTLDTKINLYAYKFYNWYTTTDFSDLNFPAKNKEVDANVTGLLAKNFGYNTQRTPQEKIGDYQMLLAQRIETGGNNIDYSTFNIDPEDTKYTQYNSLSDQSPTAPDITPNVNDLIGVSTYSDQGKEDKAKLFISYLLNSVPPPKSIYIPGEDDAVNNKVSIYLPIPDKNRNTPYKIVTVSTAPITTRGTRRGSSIFSQGSSPTNSEYSKMLDYLNKDAEFYQKYKMLYRTNNILRGIYLETIFKLFEERSVDLSKKPKEREESLAQEERKSALAGLSKQYYDNLKTKTVADVNLEMLHAINKLTYFVYKLHMDNERSNLLMAVSGLLSSGLEKQEEDKYINAISAVIENKCWNYPDGNYPDDKTKKICEDPQTAAITTLMAR